jgi:arylsulfatase B
MTMLRRKTLPGGGQGRWRGDRLIYSTHMGHDEPAYDANNPIVRDGQPIVENDYLTDAFTREAVSFLEQHQDQPFFLYVAYNAVHSPLQGKLEDLEALGYIDDIHRRIFAAMLRSLDQSVGTILQTLDRLDLSRNTLVIFLSDNGGPTRELTSSNLPLRGEKGSMYEGGLRVPCLMRWPGKLAAGQTCNQPISSMDFFPTAARLAGAEVPSGLDGRDLWPLLSGQQSAGPHEELFWRQGRRVALRRGDWKLVGRRLRDGDTRWELYNLSKDLAEEHDLAAAEPALLQQLVARWQKRNAEMRKPLFR